MKKKHTHSIKNILLFTLLLLLFTSSFTYAQEQTITIDLKRDMGYGGFNGDIQGRFSMRVNSSLPIASVTYFIDAQAMATLTEAPFHLTFTTDAYPPGWHVISAQATLEDGTQLQADDLKREFVEKGQVWDRMKTLVIPILIIVIPITLISVFVSMRQNKNFQLGVYGTKGGAVCKKCQLPFSRNYFSPNVGFGKLEKCPHCGKQQITRPASAAALQEAEARYTAETNPTTSTPATEEEKLKQMIENSKFDH